MCSNQVSTSFRSSFFILHLPERVVSARKSATVAVVAVADSENTETVPGPFSE